MSFYRQLAIKPFRKRSERFPDVIFFSSSKFFTSLLLYFHVFHDHIQCNKTETRIWASYQIRNIAGCACAGNAGNVFPRRRFQRKPLVSYPGMHHGTCVTHVPWCMSGSLACSDGENVPGIPGACAPAILRIWQEAHRIRRKFKHCNQHKQ